MASSFDARQPPALSVAGRQGCRGSERTRAYTRFDGLPSAWPKGDVIIAVEIKPKKISFLIETVGPVLVVLLVLMVAGGITLVWIGRPCLAVGAAGLLLMIGVVLLVDAMVAYRKERYLFADRQMIRKGGGLFRDSHTELNIGNITHVRLVLPWPRYRLFGVGQVIIDSAGGGEYMPLRALADPQGVYDHIRSLMRQNGFSLTYARRLHEEQPPPVAVVKEVAGRLVGAAVLLLVGLPAVGTLGALPGRWNVVTQIAIFLLTLLVIGGMVVALVLRALDFRRRTYTVYNDAVVYTEGFLTRNNAFLPAENLADSNTQQTLIDRILDLFDVTISCQGSGQEIRFRSLRYGPQLSRALDSLTTTFAARAEAAPAAPDQSDESVADTSESTANAMLEPSVPTATSPSSSASSSACEADVPITLQMYLPRALAPYALLAVVIVVGLAMAGVVTRTIDIPTLLALLAGNVVYALMFLGVIATMVKGVASAFVTRFDFGPRSVKRRYRLLQTRETEYSNEKLTGVVYRTNLLDRLFGTCSIHFWSIGASEPLVFANLRDRGDLLRRALQHGGIHSDETRYQMPSVWSLRATAGESLSMIVLTAVAVPSLALAGVLVSAWFWAGLGALALFWLLVLIYEPIYYRRCRAIFHDRHLEVRKGVLIRKRYYALYRNIKRVTTVRYPFVDRGRVLFHVAGHGVQTLVPVAFVDRITSKNELLDRLLTGRIASEQIADIEHSPERYQASHVHVARPALANTLVPLIGVSVIILPLAGLLPLTIPWVVMVVRRRSYRIESYRVVAEWGVVFTRQSSIVFDKIDHIQQQQGLLNKAFGNGNIQIYTAGSSTTDLKVAHIPSYTEFYEKLREQYTSERR